MKKLTKLMCLLFGNREVTLGMITDNFLKVFALACVWNLFGLGYVRDANLVPTMFTILYGGFIYLSLVIIVTFVLCFVGCLIFYIHHKTHLSSKLDNTKDIVIFKCKR